MYSLFGNEAGRVESLYREATRRFAARLATVEPSSDPAADMLRLGLAYRDYAGQLATGAPERIALACWGVAHGLVSLELTGNVPPPLDVAAGYEDALRAVVRGWRT